MVGAEDYVEVTEGSGKKLRTIKETVGANDVHQEILSIADGTTVTQILVVDAAGKIGIGVSALPAGAATEASLAIVAGDTTSLDGKVTVCNTGAVAVTSIIPLTGATNLGKAEDAAHTTGDTGVPIWGVRNDTPTSLVDVDLDYTPIAVDEYGRTKQAPIGVSPTIYNVTMTNADQEYDQALPSNCRKFLIHTRDESSFRLAFVTGKVAGPVVPYVTIPDDARYHEDHIESSGTLYFASAVAGKIIEIIAWS